MLRRGLQRNGRQDRASRRAAARRAGSSARLLHKLVVQRQARARAHAQQRQLPRAQGRRLCRVVQDRAGRHGLRQVGCHVGAASRPEVERDQLRRAGRWASVGVMELLNIRCCLQPQGSKPAELQTRQCRWHRHAGAS